VAGCSSEAADPASEPDAAKGSSASDAGTKDGAEAASGAGSPATQGAAGGAGKLDAAMNAGNQAAAEAGAPALPVTPATKEVPEAFLADAGDGWKTLITGRWQLQPQSEGYYCARYTLKQDVPVKAFRAVAPLGTHHTLLTIADDNTQPDGVAECGANTNGTRNVLGTGTGASELTMPDGVGMVLKAGEQLLLNLHLFNTSDKPLQGLSGAQVHVISESDIKYRAEEAMAGPINLEIPVGGPTKQVGECTISHDSTIFAVGPHMHQLGIHLKAVAFSSVVGEVLLYDGDYDFDNQLLVYLPQEVSMKKGDKVKVECTYQNETDSAVRFGNSSLSEMCFAGLFRYPEGQKSFICAR
jgi:hypothetical protein